MKAVRLGRPGLPSSALWLRRRPACCRPVVWIATRVGPVSENAPSPTPWLTVPISNWL